MSLSTLTLNVYFSSLSLMLHLLTRLNITIRWFSWSYFSSYMNIILSMYTSNISSISYSKILFIIIWYVAPAFCKPKCKVEYGSIMVYKRWVNRCTPNKISFQKNLKLEFLNAGERKFLENMCYGPIHELLNNSTI